MTKTNEILWREYHEEGNENSLVELVQNNQGIIYQCARDWQYAYGVDNIELEDLRGVGVEAVLVAAETYNPQKGTLFITHAKNTIDAHMQRYALANAGLIRMPEDKIRIINRIKKCRPEGEGLELNNWYECFCEKYQDNISFEQFSNLIQMEQVFGRFSSLNELLGDNQTTERQDYIGTMEDPEEMYLEESLKEEIEKCLEILSEREQQVIIASFGLGGMDCKTLKEIARDLELSIARVGDIKNQALRKLKQSSKVKMLREYL